ncbi:hypothetical protein DEO72_LG3g1950 [Vigna unguiculata]|uniref:Uncharacterized protein n=1 Tax=Vigna unguiculata TaxID=3917 RepID=A0A4D6LGZ0_VIGUN|nr:hypothetical protein DEO72_LG3g1950 [Vigna unguiculata]
MRSDPPGDSLLSEALLMFGAWRQEGSARRSMPDGEKAPPGGLRLAALRQCQARAQSLVDHVCWTMGSEVRRVGLRAGRFVEATPRADMFVGASYIMGPWSKYLQTRRPPFYRAQQRCETTLFLFLMTSAGFLPICTVNFAGSPPSSSFIYILELARKG